MSGGGPGVHTTWWRSQGLARATLWSGYPLAPLRLCFGLRLILGKNRNFTFVSSNSKNIYCVTFIETQKQQKTGN
jgi:hypothetical protein